DPAEQVEDAVRRSSDEVQVTVGTACQDLGRALHKLVRVGETVLVPLVCPTRCLVVRHRVGELPDERSVPVATGEVPSNGSAEVACTGVMVCGVEPRHRRESHLRPKMCTASAGLMPSLITPLPPHPQCLLLGGCGLAHVHAQVIVITRVPVTPQEPSESSSIPITHAHQLSI